MAHGKEISADICEVVVQLKQYFDSERKSGPVVSTKDSFSRTASALDIGVASIKRIVSRYKRTGSVLTGPRKRPGRPPDAACESAQVDYP